MGTDTPLTSAVYVESPMGPWIPLSLGLLHASGDLSAGHF